MLSDDTLINIIKAKRKSSIGPNDKEITKERAEALDRYHGRPDGHEQEGQSKVVTRDLSEQVGWVMPTILRTLLQSGSLAEFDPVGEEDEDAAAQETDYINHVIMKDNDGYMILHDTAWDALVLKNCYAKHYWKEDTKTRERQYKNVSIDELTIIMLNMQQQYDKVEVVSADDEGNETYSVKLKLTKTTKRCEISAVPTEELRVSSTCRGPLRTADFVEHFPRKTRSDLVEMGISKDWLDQIPSKGGATGTEQQSRNTVNDEDDVNGLALDKAMEELDYNETYLLVDYDEDGIAELRKVISVDNKIPPGDEWNEQVDAIPFTGGVVKRIPHRHVGESLDDDLKDLQVINTALLRQMLTNIWLTNHSQYVVNRRADPVSFMDNLPGGLKIIDDKNPVQDAVMPLQVPPILSQILPAIDHVSGIKENRTGISRTTTGLDPDTLRDVAKGAFLENLNRASQKVEMIIRTYSESFVKELVLNVHGILLRHQDQERVVRLRGKYVPVRPDEWMERTDLTVKVGLGTGNQEDRMRKLSLLQGLQKQAMEMGLAGPEEVYELLADIAKSLGENTPEKYLTSPEDPKFIENKQFIMGLAMQGQQQGNPLAEAEQIKGQFKIEAERMSLQQKAEMQRMSLEQDARIKAIKMQHEQELAAIKESMRYDIEREKIRSQEDMAAMKEEVKLLLEGTRMDLGKPGIGAGVQDGQ